MLRRACVRAVAWWVFPDIPQTIWLTASFERVVSPFQAKQPKIPGRSGSVQHSGDCDADHGWLSLQHLGLSLLTEKSALHFLSLHQTQRRSLTHHAPTVGLLLCADMNRAVAPSIAGRSLQPRSPPACRTNISPGGRRPHPRRQRQIIIGRCQWPLPSNLSAVTPRQRIPRH